MLHDLKLFVVAMVPGDIASEQHTYQGIIVYKMYKIKTF